MSMETPSPKQANNNNKWLHLLVFVSHNAEQKHYCSQGYCGCSCLNSYPKPEFYTTHKWHQLQSKAEVTERGSCGWHMIGVALKSAERLQLQCQYLEYTAYSV